MLIAFRGQAEAQQPQAAQFLTSTRAFLAALKGLLSLIQTQSFRFSQVLL